MSSNQSALPVIIVLTPLLISFVLPVLGWWRRAAVFPTALAALAVSFGASLAAAHRVSTHGPIRYYMGGWELSLIHI